YGPYSENLRHVLRRVEGHWISGYADGGDAPDKQLHLIIGAVNQAEEYLVDKERTLRHFRRVSELVEGFETPFGLELLATVHWLVNEERCDTFDDIIQATYAWNQRKKQFSERQIKLAIDALFQKGWAKAFVQ